MKRRAHALIAGSGAALAIAAVLGLAGCRGARPPDLPSGAQVLHLAEETDIPTLDPAIGYDSVSWRYELAIFDTLVRYSKSGVTLEPDLAVSWQASPDATVFTFHLRSDARFSNDRPVTAADLRYEIERVLTPATASKGMQYYREIKGARNFIAGRARHVSGIETPGPFTIIFDLDRPDPLFVDKLSMPFAAAVPPKVASRWGQDFSRHVIGSGPFMLRQWLSGQRLVLVRNPYYFRGGLPHLDAVVALLNVNRELEWLKFRAGELDISRIPQPEFTYVMKTPALRALTMHKTAVRTWYLGMNCQMPPFDDVRVRRAFNYAIDRTKLVALFHGAAVVARGVLPPNLPGFNPNLKGYTYDPAKARSLLKQAGVKRGFAPELWLRADPAMIEVAESIQQDLLAVGVHVMLRPIAWGPLLEAVRQPHTTELFLFGWEADFPDPQNFLEVLLSRRQWGSNNDSFFSDPRVEKLLDEAAPLTDMKKRYALFDDAEQIVVSDAPWVFLYHPVSWRAVQPWLHGYALNPMRPPRLEGVWLSPHRPRR